MTDDDLAQSWRRIRAELRTAVSDATWQLYLEGLDARRLDGGTLVVTAPDASRAWITERFSRLLQAATGRVLGTATAVRLVGPDDPVAQEEAPAPAARAGWTASDVPFNARFTFDQFVIGDSNRLAHGAALAVAEMPALAYNPLFICGPPGLGKTHLLHSIANYVAAYGDGLTVRYTTVEAFTNHFIGALHNDGIDAFKTAYRDVDVLLVDDVQFLQRKAKTEEEFFHTFNALHAAGAQLVLTSDRLPRDMAALEDRLRERFEAGLVCDVKPPDFGTRLTILRKRVLQDGVRGVEPDALELIAERVDANIRALEGALIRIVAFGSLTGRVVDRGLVEEVLGGLYPDLRPRARRSRRSSAASARRSTSPWTTSSPPAARSPSPGRGRSPCTSRASSPTRRCRPSAARSATATTRRCCTPASARPRASPRTRPRMTPCNDSTPSSVAMPTGTLERLVRSSAPHPADIRGFVHTIHNPDDGDQLLIITST